MVILQALTYLVVVIAAIALVKRGLKIANAPTHFRWEIYPVPHERGRAEYGGSRLEETNWWEKEQRPDVINEIKEMASEILLLKGVRENNLTLWVGSFPFHFALYMFMTNIVLMLIAAVMLLTGNEIWVQTGWFGQLIYWLINICVWGGGIMGTLGALRLLFQRIVDSGMNNYSTPSHFFNLILIGAIFATALIWIAAEPRFIYQAAGFYAGLISFSAPPVLPFIGVLNVIFTLFFILYLPFTHMTHFFTKYFIYHNVRWEDAPNVSGSKMQKEIEKLLNQPVTWAAPHIGADGQKTWLAVASSTSSEEKENENG